MDPKRLFDFLAASPSCYHAVQALSDRLTQEGYTQLHEADAWTLTAGGKYFVTRNGSSLLAFRVPAGAPAGFLMAAAHTDSPTFKIKHNPEKKAGPYVQLSTEKYGGMLMGTWFDRPLSVAGRVVTAKDGKLETKLVDVNRDLLVIPSVAIHMNRAANDGFKLMANVDTLPLYGMQEAAGSFLHAVERKRIDVRHELEAVVRGAVHVDGDGGDDEQITVDVDQLRLQLPVLRRDHAAGDGQRPVKPGTHEHAAVFFRRQLNIGPGLLFRVVLDLEGGRVGMRRGHQKARGRARRHAEGKQGRAVARDKILSARRERPRVRLVQLRIALLRQPVGQRLHGVIAAGAGGQKIKKPFGIHEKTSMRRFLGFFQYSAPAGCPQGRKFAGCLFNADNLW